MSKKIPMTCDYCLYNKTTRIVITTDGESCHCCKDCYNELKTEGSNEE